MEAFHFGERLKAIRESKGVSQEALGARLGVSQPRISDMEKCKYLPRDHDLNTIASFLKTDIHEITPAWWHKGLEIGRIPEQGGYRLARWGQVVYIILLLSFGWDIYAGLVESPLKIGIGILVFLLLGLIYKLSIRK
jgi:transcriptional regulator with XRE-family HTH domain